MMVMEILFGVIASDKATSMNMSVVGAYYMNNRITMLNSRQTLYIHSIHIFLTTDINHVTEVKEKLGTLT